MIHRHILPLSKNFEIVVDMDYTPATILLTVK